MNSIGVLLAFLYLAVMFSQLRLRTRLQREDPAALTYRLWLHPYLSWAVIAVLGAVLVFAALMSSMRTQLISSAVAVVIAAAAYPLRARLGATLPLREVSVLKR